MALDFNLANKVMMEYESVFLEDLRRHWWYDARGYGPFGRGWPRLTYFRPWYDGDCAARQWGAVGASLPFRWIDDLIAHVRSWRRARPLRTRLAAIWSATIHGIPECEMDHY